jgi:hypothetical protein
MTTWCVIRLPLLFFIQDCAMGRHACCSMTAGCWCPPAAGFPGFDGGWMPCRALGCRAGCCHPRAGASSGCLPHTQQDESVPPAVLHDPDAQARIEGHALRPPPAHRRQGQRQAQDRHPQRIKLVADPEAKRGRGGRARRGRSCSAVGTNNGMPAARAHGHAGGAAQGRRCPCCLPAHLAAVSAVSGAPARSAAPS